MVLTSNTNTLEMFQVEFLHWMGFWQVRGEVVAGTQEISSILFWNSDFVECLYKYNNVDFRANVNVIFFLS